MYRDYDEERDDELYHYGVIGMKWGTHLSKEVRGAKKRRDADDNYKNVIASARLYQKPFGKNELKHFGVLGMKWGKRKQKPALGPVDGFVGSDNKFYYHDTPGVY